jgi:hypothetical protein
MTTSGRHYILVLIVWVVTLTALFVVQLTFGEI